MGSLQYNIMTTKDIDSLLKWIVDEAESEVAKMRSLESERSSMPDYNMLIKLRESAAVVSFQKKLMAKLGELVKT